MAESNRTTTSFLENVVAGLKSSHLVMLMTGIFLVDLIIPDPIFLVDEIMLGLVTILVARWKGRAKAQADAKVEAEEAAAYSKPPPKNVTPEPGVGR